MFGRREGIAFSYTTNVSAHAGVTLKKTTTATTKIKQKHTVKLTMNIVTEITVSGFLL